MDKLKDGVSFREELVFCKQMFSVSIEIVLSVVLLSKKSAKICLLKLLLQKTYKSVRYLVPGV